MGAASYRNVSLITHSARCGDYNVREKRGVSPLSCFWMGGVGQVTMAAGMLQRFASRV